MLEDELVVIDVLERRWRVGAFGKDGQVEGGVEGDRGCVHLTVAALHVHRKAIVGLPEQPTVDVVVLETIYGRRVVLELVAPEAVRVPVGTGETEEELVLHDGATHRPLDEEAVIVAVARLDAAGELLGGALRGNDDRSRCRVAAVDGALRPFEHFDLLQGRILAVERRRVGMQDPVDNERKAVLRVPGAVDAADVHLGVPNLCGIDEAHAGSEPDEVLHPLHAGPLDGGLADGRHGAGHVLHGLRPPPCGHHQFLDHRAFAFGVGDPWNRDGRRQHSEDQSISNAFHSLIP